jgi:hypothetical protein
VVIVKLLIYT